MAEPTERRRPATRRKTSLQRSEIVDAAILSSERYGTVGLSMRSLAQDLGVTAMAIYGHVADKDEILDEVLDHALARDAPPLPMQADWRSWLIDSCQQLRGVLVAEPPLLARYCRRPVGVPSALRRMEAALDVLVRSGFSERRALAVFASAHTFTLGFTALEVARHTDEAAATSRQRPRGMRPTASQDWPTLFGGLPVAEFPHLRRLQPDLSSFTSTAQFHEGLRALLAGFRPAAERRRSPRSTPDAPS